MRMRHCFLLILAGVTASAFVWGGYSDTALDQERRALSSSTAPQVPITTSAASQHGRVLSAKAPLLASPHLPDAAPAEPIAAPRRWASVDAPPKNEPASKRLVATAPSRNLTSLKPGDADARAQLVRDIQYELKRVGCYGGDVNGSWSSSTKQSMRLFTDRVNASLPLDEPDYVLLTLVQTEKPGTCGRGCPEGQMASEDGRCLPRAIVAQRGGRKDAAPIAPDQTVAPVIGSQAVTATGPPPGRMGVGASLEGTADPRAIVPQGLAGGQTRLGTPADASAALPRTALDTPDADAVQPPLDPQARRVAPAAPKRAKIQRGSTRQVFSNLMRYAP